MIFHIIPTMLLSFILYIDQNISIPRNTCSHHKKYVSITRILQNGELLGGGGLVAKSCPTLATPWTIDCQVLSTGFSRQEYWSGLPFPSPGDLPDPEIKPRSPVLQEDSLPTEIPGKPDHKQHDSIIRILQDGQLLGS